MNDVPTPQALPADELAHAIARLGEMAGDLRLHSEWSNATVRVVPGGVHVSADGAALANFQVKGSGNYLFTGEGVEMSRMYVVLRATNSFVYIGTGAVCGDLTCVRMTGGYGNFVYIGARCHLLRANILINGPEARMVIGEDCVLEYGNIVTNSDGHSIFNLESGKEINPDADVSIGDQVFIGAEAMINKGSQIGRGSVVAARSVVQGVLPAEGYHIGFPARCRRRGIRWSRNGARGIPSVELDSDLSGAVA